MKPSPAPGARRRSRGRVPGYSGDSWIETNRTRGSRAEDVVRAVAVVHVEVEDHHALRVPAIERVAGADRDAVEQAEAHRAVDLGVVPGRPVHRGAGARARAEQLVDERLPRRPRRAAPPRSEPSDTTVSRSIAPPPAAHSASRRATCAGGCTACRAARARRPGSRARASPASRAPRAPARSRRCARCAPDARRCRARSEDGWRQRTGRSMARYGTPRMTPPERIEADVAVVGRRRRGALRRP